MSIENAMNISIEDRVAWFRRDLEKNPLAPAAMIATADLRFLLDAIDARSSVQPPTRKQIAALTQHVREAREWGDVARGNGVGGVGNLDSILDDMAAVLALFQQPTPSTEPSNAVHQSDWPWCPCAQCEPLAEHRDVTPPPATPEEGDG